MNESEMPRGLMRAGVVETENWAHTVTDEVGNETYSTVL